MYLLAAIQHAGRHVGERDPPGGQLAKVALKRLVVGMGRQRSVEGVALDHEQVRLRRQDRQGVHPLGVAGVGERLRRVLHPKAERSDALAVVDLARGDLQAGQGRRLAFRPFVERQVETPVAVDAAEQRLAGVLDPRLRARRAGDLQRARTLGLELQIEQEKRQAASPSDTT